ncbi:MAG: hypothetical protein ABIF18_03580 [archaeon]
MANRRAWNPKGIRLNMSLGNVKSNTLKELGGLVGEMSFAVKQNNPDAFDTVHKNYEAIAKDATLLEIYFSSYDKTASACINIMVNRHLGRYSE